MVCEIAVAAVRFISNMSDIYTRNNWKTGKSEHDSWLTKQRDTSMLFYTYNLKKC